MANVLIACTENTVAAIQFLVPALQRLDVEAIPHLGDHNPPSAHLLERSGCILVLVEAGAKPQWAIDAARGDPWRFVFVTSGALAVDLPSETISLPDGPVASIVDKPVWPRILEAIGMRIDRLGLAAYYEAELSGDRAALDAWVMANRDDPLALRSLPVVKRMFDRDESWLDARVKTYRIDAVPDISGMEGFARSVGGQSQAGPSGSPAGGGGGGDDYVVYNDAAAVGADLTAGIDFGERTVSMLYATDRQKTVGLTGPAFTGERADELSYGGAVVRVPEQHKIGRVELPFKLSILSWNIFTMPADPSKHFILKSTQEMTHEAWCSNISAAGQSDILIFVHGFNTEFEEAALHFGQIAFDLQCKAIPILYSWPSRGTVQDYRYDDESTNISKDRFAGLLRTLASLPNAKRIHVLAHSMGNKVVLEALTQLIPTASSGIAEVMMAAPDVDSVRFKQIAGQIRAIVKGMTLYASSADKALALSKSLSGQIARAGDVPPGGPVVVPGIEAIDVTALGAELFGLNHATFAESRSILNDVHLVMTQGTRPPNARLPELLSMPLGAASPTFWKYAD